jgi:polar amino acid transport system substrate-binding protein
MQKTTLLILIGALLSPCTFAMPTFTVVTEIFPPYQYEVGGRVVGSATEIVEQVLLNSGIKAEITPMPWSRAYTKALEEKNVLIFSMQRTAQREKQFHWIGPVGKLNMALITLHPKPGVNINKITDAHNYLVAVNRYSAPHDFLLHNGFSEDENLYVFATLAEEINLLINNKVDFIFTDPNAIAFKLTDKGYEQDKLQVVLWEPKLSKKVYLAASLLTDRQWLERITAVMEEFMQSPQYQSLFYKGEIFIPPP